MYPCIGPAFVMMRMTKMKPRLLLHSRVKLSNRSRTERAKNSMRPFDSTQNGLPRHEDVSRVALEAAHR